MLPLDHDAQIAAAGDKPDAVDFRVTVQALGDGVKADFAGRQDFDVNKRKDFLNARFFPVNDRFVMLDNPAPLVVCNRRPDFGHAAPGQRRDGLRGRAGVAGQNCQNLIRLRHFIRLGPGVRLVHNEVVWHAECECVKEVVMTRPLSRSGKPTLLMKRVGFVKSVPNAGGGSISRRELLRIGSMGLFAAHLRLCGGVIISSIGDSFLSIDEN